MEKKPKPFLDIIIPEQPIAMQRPRININASTRTAHVYNPQAREKTIWRKNLLQCSLKCLHRHI